VKNRWRIIDTGPADAQANMAFDEALLRSYSTHLSLPTFRVYGWEPAALSLGYSQDAKEALGAETPDLFVRRITGGGIIKHGNELTYSLVCAKEDLGIPESVVSAYKAISLFLITFYKKLGLDAAFACDVAAPGEKLGVPSVFCFESKEKYDIVVGGRKLGGSAQKRSRNVIFQHGSIPLGSLKELLGRPVNAPALSKALVEAFIATFGMTAEKGRLSAAEEALFHDLKTRKYQSREWNFNRIDMTTARHDHAHSTALVGQ
jgi:Lipoate-protein ligase A